MSFGTGHRFTAPAGRGPAPPQLGGGGGRSLQLPSGRVIDISQEDRITGELAALSNKLHRMAQKETIGPPPAPSLMLLGERGRAMRSDPRVTTGDSTPLAGGAYVARAPSTAEVAHSMGIRIQQPLESTLQPSYAALGGVAIHGDVSVPSGTLPHRRSQYGAAAAAPATRHAQGQHNATTGPHDSGRSDTNSLHLLGTLPGGAETMVRGPASPGARGGRVPGVGGMGGAEDSSDSEDSHVREKAMQSAVADLARREVRKQLQMLGIAPPPLGSTGKGTTATARSSHAIPFPARTASPLQQAAEGLRRGEPAQQKPPSGSPGGASSVVIHAGVRLTADFSPDSTASSGPSDSPDIEAGPRYIDGEAEEDAHHAQVGGAGSDGRAQLFASTSPVAARSLAASARPLELAPQSDAHVSTGSADLAIDSGGGSDRAGSGAASGEAEDLLGAFRPGMTAQQRRLWIMTLGQARAQLLREDGEGVPVPSQGGSSVDVAGGVEADTPTRPSSGGMGQLLEPLDRRPQGAKTTGMIAASGVSSQTPPPLLSSLDFGGTAASAVARRLSPPTALVAALSSQVATMTAQLAQLYSEVSALRGVSAMPAAATQGPGWSPWAAGSPRAGGLTAQSGLAAPIAGSGAVRSEASSPLELPLRPTTPSPQLAPAVQPPVAWPAASPSSQVKEKGPLAQTVSTGSTGGGGGDAALVQHLVAKIDALEAQVETMRREQQQQQQQQLQPKGQLHRGKSRQPSPTPTESTGAAATEPVKVIDVELPLAAAAVSRSRPPRRPEATGDVRRPARAVKRTASAAARGRRGGNSSGGSSAGETSAGSEADDSSREQDRGQRTTASVAVVPLAPAAPPAPPHTTASSVAHVGDVSSEKLHPLPRLDLAVALAEYAGDPAQHQLSFSEGDTLGASEGISGSTPNPNPHLLTRPTSARVAAVAHRLPSGWWYAHLVHPEDLVPGPAAELFVAPASSRLAEALADRGEASAARRAQLLGRGKRLERSPTDSLDFSRQGYVPGDFVQLSGAQVRAHAWSRCMRVQAVLFSVSYRAPWRLQVEVQLATEQGPERPHVTANDGGAVAAEATAILQSGARDSNSGRRSRGSGSATGRRRRQRPTETHDDDSETELPAPLPAVQSSNPLRLFQASAPPPPPPPAVVSVLPTAARPDFVASNRKQLPEYESDSDDDTVGHANQHDGPAGNRERVPVNPRAAVISQGPSPVHLRAIPSPAVAADGPVAVDWESFRASYDSIQTAVAAVKSWGPPEVPHAATGSPDASGAIAASPPQAPFHSPASRTTPRTAASSAMRQDTRSQGRAATPKRVAWSDAASPLSVDDEEEDIPPPPPLTPSMMVGSSRSSPPPVSDNAASVFLAASAAQPDPSSNPVGSSSQAPPQHVLLPLPLPPPTSFAPSPPLAASPQLVAVPLMHAQISQDAPTLPANEANREKDVRSGGVSRGPSPPPAAQPRALIAKGSFFAVGPADGHARPEFHARPTLQGVADAHTPHTQYIPPTLPVPPGSAPVLLPNSSAEKPPRAATAATATTNGGWKWSLPLGRLMPSAPAPSGALAQHTGPPHRILPVDPDAVPAQPPLSQPPPLQPPPSHLQQHPPFPVSMPTQPSHRMYAAMPVAVPAPLQYGGAMRPPAALAPPPRVGSQSQAPPPFQVAQLGAPQFQQQPRPSAPWNATGIGAQQLHGRRGSSSSTETDRPGAMLHPRATWPAAAAAATLPLRGLPTATAAAPPAADSRTPIVQAQPPGSAATAAAATAGMSAAPVRFSDALSSANDAMGLILRMQQRRGLA